MKKIIFIAFLLASCGETKKTHVRFTHQVIVTYNNGDKDTVVFHSNIVEEEEHYTETGCAIGLVGETLYIKGSEESGLSRSGVRKYDHKVILRSAGKEK